MKHPPKRTRRAKPITFLQMNIARTTLSSKILSQHKDFFAKMSVDAVLRLKKSGNLDAIQIIKVPGGLLEESFLDEGEVLSFNTQDSLLLTLCFSQAFY